MRGFRREWVFPVLVVALVSVSAQASRDALSAQAARDLRCNVVTIDRVDGERYSATGCGRERTYDCSGEGDCTWDDTFDTVTTQGSSADDDAAADAIAAAVVDIGCACASAALGSHGSHATSTRTTHKHKH